MNLTSTILKELTGKDTHNFTLVNRSYNPNKNLNSSKTKKFKNKDWDYIADLKPNWSQLYFRDAFFDASGITRAIRIDIDDYRPYQCLEADIAASGITPNFIMETTKGFHLFYIFTKSQKPEYLEDFTIKLNRILRGDNKAVGSAKWRVPETYSYSNNRNPKFCKVIYQNFNRLDFDKSASVIGSMSEQSILLDIFSDAGYTPTIQTIEIEPENSYRKVYKSGKIGKSEQYLQIEKALKGATGDKDLLKSFLGVKTKKQSFACPYHKDNKPSAGIFKAKGNWVYHCFSCNVKADLIGLVEVKENRKGRNLIQRVLQLSGNSDLIGENYVKPELDLTGLDGNLNLISSLYCNTYPTPPLKQLTNEEKSVQTFTNSYSNFLNFAKTKIRMKEMIFPGSLTEIFRASGKKKIEHSTSEIYHLVAMGWIKRLKAFEIPAEQLEKTRAHNSNHKNKEISWWFIPEMTPELLQAGLQTLQKLRKAGITLRNISKKTILEAFGKEMLETVFVGNSDYKEWIVKSREATKNLFDDVDTEFKAKKEIECLISTTKPTILNQSKNYLSSLEQAPFKLNLEPLPENTY